MPDGGDLTILLIAIGLLMYLIWTLLFPEQL